MTTRMTPAVGDLAVERSISKVAESFRFVLDVTPVTAADQRRAYLSGAISEPSFAYRALEADPAVLAAELSAIDLDSVDDVSLRALLLARHREVELQLQMLLARGSADFLPFSRELYGSSEPDLMELAERMLDSIPLPGPRRGPCVLAAEFAGLAEAELAHYRALEPDIGAHVEIRPDVAGIMVSNNVLLVSAATNVAPDRVSALLQHEVGTHLLTHVNGTFQPIEMMAAGLAGYEETQEGLAVLAEYVVGGLSRFRLRQLAARVVAVSQMTRGDPFRAVHEALVRRGFSPNSAFTTAMRVFRSGGFTKDAIYLRGFVDVLRHLQDHRDLDILWMGKLSLSQLPVLEDLLERGMLRPPRLRPRYLEFPGVSERLDHAVTSRDLFELIGEVA
jgi:uncharacterized protein (TIGR02421 family)